MLASVLRRLAASTDAAEVCNVRAVATSASWRQEVQGMASRKSHSSKKAKIFFTTDVKREEREVREKIVIIMITVGAPPSLSWHH